MRDTSDLFIEPGTNSYDFREDYQRIADGYRRYMILRTSVELHLFDHMTVPSTAEEIAARAHADTGMVDLVCRALEGMGLILMSDGRYVNTDDTNHYMVSTSGLYLGGTFSMIDKGLDSFDMLGNSILKGNVPRAENPDRFYHSMTAFGEFSKGGFIAELMDFIEEGWISPGNTVLDVAGGHGLYSIALQYRYPDSKVCYFDRKEGARVAYDNFRKYGADISVETGDYYKGDIPGVYDVLVSSFNDSACKPELVPKMSKAVKDGGLVILRRYVITVQDPLERVIQVNISRQEGSPMFTGRRGQSEDEREAFAEAMAEYGFKMIKRVGLDNGTEMTAYRKGDVRT